MDPFSETARATRSISEPLTKAEREALAVSAATAAADATHKAGDGESAQASAARSAEEAVHQATHVRSRWLWFHTFTQCKNKFRPDSLGGRLDAGAAAVRRCIWRDARDATAARGARVGRRQS
jgi:hypothetical protein